MDGHMKYKYLLFMSFMVTACAARTQDIEIQDTLVSSQVTIEQPLTRLGTCAIGPLDPLTHKEENLLFAAVDASGIPAGRDRNELCGRLYRAWADGRLSDAQLTRIAEGQIGGRDRMHVSRIYNSGESEVHTEMVAATRVARGSDTRSLSGTIEDQPKEQAHPEGVAAVVNRFPSYDVDAHCDVIARVGGSRSQRLFNTCIDQEQKAYDGLKKQWDAYPSDAQAHCDTIAQVAGAGSYRLLATCLKREREAAGAPKRFKP